jgi:potassium efflux system protein
VNPFIRLATKPSHGITGLLIAVCLSISLVVKAQDISLSGIATDGSATAEQLESAIRSIEARDGFEEETRVKVLEQLRDAAAQLQNRLSAEAAAQAFTAALNEAPAESEALRKKLDTEAAAPTLESFGVNESTNLVELEQVLTQEMAELAALESRLVELEARVETQEDRPAAARTRIDQLRRSREELAAVVDTPAAPGEPPILTEARIIAASLRRAAQGAEISRLEQELLSHGVRLTLLKAQRDVEARARVEGQRRVELLRGLVNEKRQAAAMTAQEAAVAAELASADKHPVVRALAEGNAGLTRELPAVTADIERVTALLDQIRREATDIEQRLARSRQRLEIAGLSRAIGQLLVEERRNLPQVSQYRAQVRARSSALAEIGLAQVRIQEQRREMTPLDARVEELMAEVANDVAGQEELDATRSEIRLLLQDRRELLAQADSTYRSYLQALGDLDVAQRRLLGAAAEYQGFLNQNLLWIPSAPIAFTGDFANMAPAFVKAVSPELWLVAGADLAASVREHATEAVFCLLVLTILLVLRRPLMRRHEAMNSLVGSLSTDHIGLTIAALAIAVTRALPMSLLLAMIAWLLENNPEQSMFSSAVARSLFGLAPFLYNVLLFRVLSARNGVLSVHLGWSDDNLKIIRRQLDRLVAVGAPLVFATIFFFSSEIAGDRATMGRLTFLALMLLIALVVRPLAHPDTGVVTTYYERNPDRWISRLRWFWYALSAGGPVLLALISMLGYLYTSLILTGRLINTLWLALSLIVVNLVVLRWLALTRRKLAMQIALQEREAKLADRGKEANLAEETELPVAAPKPMDFEAVDQQTRRLLRSVLFFVAVIAGWGIWADVLPAFNLLDRVALWSQTVMLDGVETIVPVTLADILLALVVAAVTAVASRNLPGLMEIAILQRLTLQPGSRYAINTLVRYVVVTIGAVSVLNIVGWNWSQIQWLVAALSVGLGFGLQEIVANFVSGLVILFERPVRVGDTVTVGQLTGTVSRVRIRATTITDWDRKEIIVPNKSFITEQVVNWTLSDPITRLVIPVGISYGSDVELAHKVMEDTVQSLPLVLDEPPPRVYFIGFGESSLDFKLYIYSRELSDRLPLMHAVHGEILKALRKNGIEIPFPQRDLHIRSTVEGKDD